MRMSDVFKMLEGIVLREVGKGGLNEKVKTEENVSAVLKKEDGTVKKMKNKK